LMMPGSISAQVRSRVVAAAALAIDGVVLLAGCSASTIADHLPTAAGGLPAEAPKRQVNPGAFPSVHDRSRERNNSTMTVNEQWRLEDDLTAARNRVNASPASSPEPNP